MSENMRTINGKTIMRLPLVSVITPCYNDGKYILDAVACVAKSTYANIEHIIINDGSTDSYTLDVLSRIDNPHVRIIHTENQGVCNARNIAIGQSSGKYILPLDADDLISKEYISLAVDILEADENVKMVTTNYRFFGGLDKRIQVEPYTMEKLLVRNLYVVASLFRRTDFDLIGGFNINMKVGLEDWDFWLSLLTSGGEVAVLEKEHFYYRFKPQNESRNRSGFHDNPQILRRKIWENHRELYSSFFPDPFQTPEYLYLSKSKEYRLGKALLTPIRKLLDVIRFYFPFPPDTRH
jgi:glycosyltransferase involved in cell wall biosynthesis